MIWTHDAFGHPDEAGNGEHLPLVSDFMSFNEIVDTPKRQGRGGLIVALPESQR
ncbi:hypothetical protein [Mesorhizobium sp.]|uniref:hypothetical protein n=1 Tax=Mesorhizobium sp. TaxID=1871066 RepID=UPI00257C69A2|nr:hypothetical protein [Mesorhizobium sp.]